MNQFVRYAEVFGLVLILFSAGWEFFVERPLAQISSNADQYEIERKIDALWNIGTDAYSHSSYNRTKILVNANFEHTQNIYRYAGEGKNGAAKQLSNFQVFRAFLFFIGSMLIIFGKYNEIRRSHN